MENQEDNWKPLESNPEVINSYIKDLGFDINQFALQDILSTEDWGQEMIPNPVLAVIFLYPISENQENWRQVEAEKIAKDGQKLSQSVSQSFLILIMNRSFSWNNTLKTPVVLSLCYILL